MCSPAGQRPVVWLGVGRVGDVVRALHVAVAVGRVVEEPVHRGEGHAAVGEPEERLVHAGPVPLGADLEEVVAPEHGDVVQHLEPVVVRVCSGMKNGMPIR